MKLIKTYTFLIACLLSISGYSQQKKNAVAKKPIITKKNVVINEANGYAITLNTKNLQNEKITFYMLYGTAKKQIVNDSITIKSNDQIVNFKFDKKIIGAIYFLKIESQPKTIELAIDNNTTATFSLENNNVETLICTKDQKNSDFINYQKTEKSLTIDQRIEARNVIAKKYPSSILNLYFKLENLIVEKVPATDNEKIKFRNTFFSSFDKDDKRIYLLPNINKFLYKYVNILPITNENYIQNIDLVLKGMDCKSRNYAVYAKYFMVNISFYESKNLEESFNHLFKNYFDGNKCKAFTDNDMATYNNKYITNKKIPLNSKIPDFDLVTKDSTSYTLSKIYPENDFTLVAFYSPTCEHCQKNMPVVSDFFTNLKTKYPEKKIQMIAVLNDDEEDKWESFIAEKKLANWLNLKCADVSKKYKEDFNAYSNPCYFLINKSGTVVLKSFNNKAIEEIIKGN